MTTEQTELDEILDSIWAYGVDWTEQRDKSETDHEVSVYAAKVKGDMKAEFKQALTELIERKVREALEGIAQELRKIAVDVDGYDGWTEDFVKGYQAATHDNELNVADRLQQLKDSEEA